MVAFRLEICSETLHTQVKAHWSVTCKLSNFPLKPGIQVSPSPILLYLPTLSIIPPCLCYNWARKSLYLSLEPLTCMGRGLGSLETHLSSRSLCTKTSAHTSPHTHLETHGYFTAFIHTLPTSLKRIWKKNTKICNSRRRKCPFLHTIIQNIFQVGKVKKLISQTANDT